MEGFGPWPAESIFECHVERHGSVTGPFWWWGVLGERGGEEAGTLAPGPGPLRELSSPTLLAGSKILQNRFQFFQVPCTLLNH